MLDMVRTHMAILTPRERQVFDLVIRGGTNKHVARVRLHRAYNQSPSPHGDEENAGCCECWGDPER